MAKLKHLSIKVAAIIIMSSALLLATILSAITNKWLEQKRSEIAQQYIVQEDRYYLTNEQGEQLGDGVIISNASGKYSQEDKRTDRIVEVLTMASVPFYFVVCILMAAFLFYRWKIQRPLAILEEATSKIAQQNLDFSIQYPIADEMGKLVASFEQMRNALNENNQYLWRTAEERKRVNAAFAHDLRTPLTVLKGYNSFILTNLDDPRLTKEKIHSTSTLMEHQIYRLEGFVDSMNSVQKLEQLTINLRKTTTESICLALEETTNILDSHHFVQLDILLGESTIYLDLDIVLQIYENLLNNALRYAKNSVEINVRKMKKHLVIQVMDDGPGFTKEALQKATSPFYRGQCEDSEVNFGLGLFISKVLCEKHGGELKLSNGQKGAVMTATFQI